MSGNISRLTVFPLLILAGALAGDFQRETPSPLDGAKPEGATKARVQAALAKLPLYFIENRGQVDTHVAYYVQGQDTILYFTAQGVTFALTGPGGQPPAADTPVARAAWRLGAIGPRPAPGAWQRWVVKLDFVGANPGVKPIGQDPTPAVGSYFKGPQDQWKTGLKTYASLVYADLWPGIDLLYTGTASQLKATFVVKPVADPRQIKLAYRGATVVTLTDAGQLDVQTPAGSFAEEKPYAYQKRDGRRVEVATAYTLDANVTADTSVYGFHVGAYDTSQPLVLDPVVLVYAGYIGGADIDNGRDIAVDAAGNAYVTGRTASTEATFPVTVGPDLTHNGSVDAFVAKVAYQKKGGSQSSHLLDEATKEVFRQVKQLTRHGHAFRKIVHVQFSLQTFERLPIGTEVLEPTAITGGQATLLLTSTEDPNVVSVRLLRLRLEGLHFAFTFRIKAITGTLDFRTGAFHLTLSFRRLMTPETLQPFTWEGTAEGVYDFDSGVVSLTEIGHGLFLTE